VLRRYTLNSLLVSGASALGVVVLGSLTAYVLSRQRFFGSRAIFLFIIATMMFPGVLTFVPSFMLVREMGLLNTYWAMILPYIAGGQVFAIFVFKGFFDGLPEELFESARIDGAGHLQLYWRLVLPLSKPIFSVVMVMNVLGTWNNFLWPFVTNSEDKHHVIASGLYILYGSSYNQNLSTLFAAYTISSIPLLILFVFATRPFIQGITAGAFKA
jgi:ABC-type glycerol-3-phosphate transport system permease component